MERPEMKQLGKIRGQRFRPSVRRIHVDEIGDLLADIFRCVTVDQHAPFQPIEEEEKISELTRAGLLIPPTFGEPIEIRAALLRADRVVAWKIWQLAVRADGRRANRQLPIDNRRIERVR